MYWNETEELTKTFMMILFVLETFGLHGLYKNMSALYGLNIHLFSLTVTWSDYKRL